MNRTLQCFVVAGMIFIPNLLAAQPPGRGGQGGMNGRGGPPPEMIYQLFTTADANNDGSVTKAELMAVMQNKSRGNQLGRGGPPPMNGDLRPGNPRGDQPPQGGRGGQHGPPPEPGQVLPEPVALSLNLNDRQSRQLAALQADVDRRLAAILTDEQQTQLRTARPPQGHAPMEAGDDARLNQRPQRPQ